MKTHLIIALAHARSGDIPVADPITAAKQPLLQRVRRFAQGHPRRQECRRSLALIFALAFLSAATSAFAQSRDTELKVERRTLDRQDKVSRPRQNAQELTRGLRITVKNIGLGATAEGEVEWAILVARPGMQKALFDSGKEKLGPLKASEVATFDVGSIAVQDIGNKKQDMEYQVIVRRGGAEVAKLESTATFSQQAESARGAGKKRKKAK